jgi:hypothetical protein
MNRFFLILGHFSLSIGKVFFLPPLTSTQEVLHGDTPQIMPTLLQQEVAVLLRA